MLEEACFSLPWSTEQCQTAFLNPAFAAFGLYAAATLFAYISFYHVVDEMEIVNLAVDPCKRRQGFGRLLLTTALQTGQKMGMHKVWLEVREKNTPALALYSSVGFTKEGVRKGYYTDTNEDAFILEKMLSDSSS